MLNKGNNILDREEPMKRRWNGQAGVASTGLGVCLVALLATLQIAVVVVVGVQPDLFGGRQLAAVDAVLEPSEPNEGEREPSDVAGLELVEYLAKLVVFIGSIELGATGGYVRRGIALIGLLSVLSGVAWF